MILAAIALSGTTCGARSAGSFATHRRQYGTGILGTTAMSMDKRFDPKTYEPKWQSRWAEQGIFVCEAPSAKPSFCIMIPPPNVTGKLHMGHALQSTLQDLLVRWKRMQGYNALWLPGTDHAGIATQLMVERQLQSEGTSRAGDHWTLAEMAASDTPELPRYTPTVLTLNRTAFSRGNTTRPATRHRGPS